MMDGCWPAKQHDMCEFDDSDDRNDARIANIGKQARKGVVIYAAGDWMEGVTSFGLPSWKSNVGACPCCNATEDTNMHEYLRCTISNTPWATHDSTTHDKACINCEIIIDVEDKDTYLTIRNNLTYDRRKAQSAARGRALKCDIPRLGLQKWDRLEPTPWMPDVALVDKFDFNEPSNYPLRLIFWRRTLETFTRRRCPLFSSEINTSVEQNFAIDMLHAFYLGVVPKWIGLVLWEFIKADVFNTGMGEDAKVVLTLRQIRKKLWDYYRIARKDKSRVPWPRMMYVQIFVTLEV